MRTLRERQRVKMNDDGTLRSCNMLITYTGSIGTCKWLLYKETLKTYSYIEVVTVHCCPHTSLLFKRKLLLGELQNQRFPPHFISTINNDGLIFITTLQILKHFSNWAYKLFKQLTKLFGVTCDMTCHTWSTNILNSILVVLNVNMYKAYQMRDLIRHIWNSFVTPQVLF